MGKSKDTEIPFIVDLKEQGIFINKKEIAFPTDIKILEKIFGKATHQDWNDTFFMWKIIWDNHGICTECFDFDTITVLKFLVKPEKRLQYLPENTFKGKVLINGQPVEEIQENSIKLNKYLLVKARYEGKDENEIYCYWLMENLDIRKKKDKNKNKYKLPKPGKNAIHFADFNFKLLIIEELMYNQELIKPKFDIYEFAELYKKRKIDIDSEGYKPIPEAVEYFKNVTIDSSLAGQITEVYQDGGNEFYMNILPFWDGEDDTFDIKSYEDIKHFPNLKKAALLCGDTKILEELKSKGIDAQTL
jgi:hypothetical protein